mgnify:CR=1 FL=1
MKLIVGLGNPGKEYESTRHNIGFMTIDQIANKLGSLTFKEDFFGAYSKLTINNENVILFKPYTYMNDSGRAVRAIVDFYKIDIDDILIIHDDLDLPTGQIRLRKDGGSGGHNGIKSIISNLNSESFKRLRIGIDKDKNNNIINYVLGKFSKEESEIIKNSLIAAAEACILWPSTTFEIVMSKYNKK